MNEYPQIVRLKESEYQKILDEAEIRAPEEACGLISGEDINGIRFIRKVYILENKDHSPEHFSLDPSEQLQAVRDMRNEGLKPLGNWHSHPATPSRPSDEDKRLAFDKTATYLIISLAEKQPVLNAFHIEGAKSRKEKLEII